MNNIEQLLAEVEAYEASSREQVEAFRIRYLGKKGVIAGLFSEMKNVQPDQKKEFGRVVNELKIKAESKFELMSSQLADEPQAPSGTDLTLPAEPYALGSRHPISIVRN
jgi:phenylalanyl-tRNA synthetase alpha chain